METWVVLYKAIADFSALRDEAAKARAELQALTDVTKAQAAAERDGSAGAAQAHRADTASIRDEKAALDQLSASAKQANVQLLYGGRNDMAQHLADLQNELRYTDLLNRSQWMGFSTVQQAVAYRQQMLNLALQENKARFGGYLTPDQWLGYLARETSATTAESSAIRTRTAAIAEATTVQLAYDNAVQGTNKSIGQLGEGTSSVSAFNDALTGLPDVVTTSLEIDDSRALAAIAVYRAALGTIPLAESTSLLAGVTGLPRTITPAAAALIAAPAAARALPGGGGGAGLGTALAAAGPPARVDVSAMRAAEKELAALTAELRALGTMTERPKVELEGAAGAIEQARELAGELHDAGQAERFLVTELASGAMTVQPAPFQQIPALEQLARQRAGGGAAGGGGAGGPPRTPPAAGAPGPEEPNPANTAAMRAAEAELVRLAAAEKAQGDAAQQAARGDSVLAGALTDSGNAVRVSGGWWGLLNKEVALFGGFLPGMLGHIALWHIALDSVVEALAVLVPASIALGAGIAASLPTVQAMYMSLKSTYTVSQAFGQQMPGLSGNFAKVADAVKPNVYVLFGEAMAIASRNTGTFSKLATGAWQALDQLGARAELALGSKGVSEFAKTAVSDLQMLGNVVGNVFGIFGNVLKVMPGYAELLLRGLQGVTGAVEQLTGSGFVQWLLGAGLAAHGAILWGGLLGTAFLKLGGSIGNVAGILASKLSPEFERATAKLGENASVTEKIKAGWTDLGNALPAIGGKIGGLGKDAEEAGTKIGLGERATSLWKSALGQLEGVPVWGWVAVGVAVVGGLAFALSKVRDGTQSWYDSTQKIIDSQTTFTGVTKATTDAIAQSNAKIAATPQYVNSAVGAYGRFGDQFAGVNTQYSEAIKYHDKLDIQQQQEQTRLDQLTRMFGSQGAALGVMNAAGIKASDIADANAQKWANDVAQLKAYQTAVTDLAGFQGGQALAAQNALNYAENEQVKALQQVTQAEDQLIGTVLSGEQTFTVFDSTLEQYGKDLGVSADKVLGLNAKQNTQAGDLYGNVLPAFQKTIDAAQQMGVKTGDLTTIIATQAGQVLTLAGNNRTAQAAVIAMINNALGPGTVSYKTLNKWVSENSTTQQGLNQDWSKATINASKLAGVLQNSLNPMMAQSIINAYGGQKAFDTFANAELSGNTQGKAFTKSGEDVVSMLIAGSSNAGQAKGKFEDFAENGLGLSKTKADALWDSLRHQELVDAGNKAGETKAQFEQLAEKLGYTKQQADTLWGSLHKVSSGSPYNANVNVNASGSGGMTFTEKVAQSVSSGGFSLLSLKAAGGAIDATPGGYLTGTGGGPRQDNQLAMVSSGEFVINANSASRIGLPALNSLNAYADGGFTGVESRLAQAPGFVSGAASGFVQKIEDDLLTKEFAHLKQVVAAAAAAKNAAAAVGAFGSLGAAPAGASSAVAALKAAAAQHGWTSAAEWNALNYVEMREAGYNIHAQNPSSGAYGMAQFINGPSEYAQYGGNASTAWGQAVAMCNYIAQRYGNPIAAANHERSDNWYASGGLVRLAAGGPPAGMDSAQAWNYWSGLLRTSGDTQKNAFWTLNNAKLPSKATAVQRLDWAKDLAAMRSEQTLVGRDRDAILNRLPDPTQVTSGQWGALSSALTTMKAWEYGKIHPDWNWAGWKYEFPLWQRANLATGAMQADVAQAFAAWNAQFGTGAPQGPPGAQGSPPPLYNTPGPRVIPVSSSSGPITVDLSSLIMGGPASPGLGGPGTMGFADGGSLGDVAGMFALGGEIPAMMPATGPTGHPMSMPAIMSKLAGGGQPRVMADAASHAGGDRIGVNIEGGITVHNPVPERAGDSITRNVSRLAFLAGRGVA